MSSDPSSIAFVREKHVAYFTKHLLGVSYHYTSLDVNRMTLLYFSLSGLDVLGELQKTLLLDSSRTREIIDWIYAMQIQPDATTGDVSRCGFRGAPYIGEPFDCKQETHTSSSLSSYDQSNLSQTYTALSCLRILGDDLSRVNKKAIIGALKYYQQEDGSFVPLLGGAECDVRFVYCACLVSHMLNDWSGFNLDTATQFLINCQTYDGAFGLTPGAEGHGGATFCATAALTLMNRVDRMRDMPALLKWCISAQGAGYRGRPNKPCDSCYSFWTQATVKMLGALHFTHPEPNRAFNLTCQHLLAGGFGKVPQAFPDLMHSYYGICGMSIFGLDGLNSLNVVLGLTERVTGPERTYELLVQSPVNATTLAPSTTTISTSTRSSYFSA